MNILDFIICGVIMIVVIIAICSVIIENCEDKIEELESRMKFQDRLVSTEMNRIIVMYSNLTDDVEKLKNNKKDKTEEDIINEELLKYSKECAKAVEDRLNKKGDGK